MGALSLYIFSKPLNVGAVGLRFTNFHLPLFCMICWHSFTLFLISRFNLILMSLLATVRLLLKMNSLTLLFCSSWYRIIIIIYLFTAIGLLPGGSGYFTCKQNIKLVATRFKSRGLREKHVVAT